MVTDIPVIPELDEVQEEDLTKQVAAPPRYGSERLKLVEVHALRIHTHLHTRNMSPDPCMTVNLCLCTGHEISSLLW